MENNEKKNEESEPSEAGKETVNDGKEEVEEVKESKPTPPKSVESEFKRRCSDDCFEFEPIETYCGKGDDETWQKLMHEDVKKEDYSSDAPIKKKKASRLLEEEEEEEEDEQEEEPKDTTSTDETDSGIDEDLIQPKFEFIDSDEDLGSDDETKLRAKFFIGRHSFKELHDPGLSKAWLPATQQAQVPGQEAATSSKKQIYQERDDYRKQCEKLGCSPNLKVLRGIHHHELNLARSGLGPKDIIALSQILLTNAKITKLNLSGNNVGKSGGEALAKLLENNYVITDLNLSNTELNEALPQICAAMGQNITVKYLNFSKNELDDQDMDGVRAILEENNSILGIDLSYNQITDRGAARIGYGLLENVSLEELNMASNKIKGQYSGFFDGVAQHRALLQFNLSHNILGQEAVKYLGKIIRDSPTLEDLDVSYNRLPENIGPIFAKALETTNSLKNLKLDCQLCHQEAAATLLRPFTIPKKETPVENIDFGYMMDVHKKFLAAKAKVNKFQPDITITHGLPYGIEKAKGPDPKSLVMKRATIVLENFGTPLCMMMDELAYEPSTMPKEDFRKFIKSCNLYKDNVLTESFEKNFPAPGGQVNCAEMLKAFDKVYPSQRKVVTEEQLEAFRKARQLAEEAKLAKLAKKKAKEAEKAKKAKKK